MAHLPVHRRPEGEQHREAGAGAVRGSLDTAVTLYADAGLAATLAALGDELRFVLITSAATVLPLAEAPDGAAGTELAGLRLQVVPSEAPKCERCWHRREDVGSHAGHPGLCGRCVENVEGAGEQRFYA